MERYLNQDRKRQLHNALVEYWYISILILLLLLLSSHIPSINTFFEGNRSGHAPQNHWVQTDQLSALLQIRLFIYMGDLMFDVWYH